MFAQKLTTRCRVEYYLHLHYFVFQCVMWVVARSLPRNVRYVAERLASFHLECEKVFYFFFLMKRMNLGHCYSTQGVMKALSQSRGGGIIITIKTIEAAEMSCLWQSMLNPLARGRAA